jgi:hypothetical protein
MAQEMGETMLELLTRSQADLLQDRVQQASKFTNGVMVGIVTACEVNGQPMVSFDPDSADGPVSAQSLVGVQRTDVGRRVCLLFEQGNRLKPIIMGFLQDQAMATPPAATELDRQGTALEAKVDGDQVVIEGKREIVLKCGEASITLTRAGKILLRAKYLLSRSSGVNRIKGGSVQIN